MLDVLKHLPGSQQQNRALIDGYLDILNDEICGASVTVYQSVFAALLDPKGHARPTGFVSDYPMLTTNLLRSSALLTKATKFGTLTTLSAPFNVHKSEAGLASIATSLDVSYQDVEVLVAHQRDFLAAQSIGMHLRFIEEIRPDVKVQKKRRKAKIHALMGPIFDSMPIPVPVGMLA